MINRPDLEDQVEAIIDAAGASATPFEHHDLKLLPVTAQGALGLQPEAFVFVKNSRALGMFVYRRIADQKRLRSLF